MLSRLSWTSNDKFPRGGKIIINFNNSWGFCIVLFILFFILSSDWLSLLHSNLRGQRFRHRITCSASTIIRKCARCFFGRSDNTSSREKDTSATYWTSRGPLATSSTSRCILLSWFTEMTFYSSANSHCYHLYKKYTFCSISKS